MTEETRSRRSKLLVYFWETIYFFKKDYLEESLEEVHFHVIYVNKGILIQKFVVFFTSFGRSSLALLLLSFFLLLIFPVA